MLAGQRSDFGFRQEKAFALPVLLVLVGLFLP
jgi:hypothetical protein